jgi:pimeloyl-ACP methyl ester carboxylesterase
VDAGGLRLRVNVWNPGGSRTLLLVHGLFGQSHAWDPVADDLARDFRVICPDLRGHGDSSWARDGYWTRNFVEDLRHVLDGLGTLRVLFVGHSLGARIGYAFGAEHPARVEGMLLSDAAPETPATAARNVARIIGSAATEHGFHSREQALAQFRAEHPEWAPVFHELDALHQLRRNWAGKYVYKHDPDLYWITRSAGGKEAPYLWDAAARATPRTLILRGNRSHYIDDALAARLEEVMPEARVESLDAGHYLPRERPREFTARLRAFAASL